MEKLTEQMEHFLLYPQQPVMENLEEGYLANLGNQVAKVEAQLMYLYSGQEKREAEFAAFVENMAHQMMNAVTALQIQLDLARCHTDEESAPALEKAQMCVERMRGEIDRILNSSQLASGKIRMIYEPLDLAAEVGRCKNQIQPSADARDVRVIFDGEENLPISGDAFWISQAVENVVKNAVEHTAPGTQVTVRVVDAGKSAVVRVEDEGEGIPESEITDIFTRFHRGCVSRKGYGIGLAMAKDVVEAHHGKIAAGNREGGGAWFEMHIPILEGTRQYEELNE